MSLICPTVLAADAHSYREQMERIDTFASRIQIDLGDGDFTALSISPAQVWFPDTLQADIHLMFRRPVEQIETLVSLNPHMVIIHAEADGDIVGMMAHVQGLGIRTGVALLQSTSVKSAENHISFADHVLIFSGNLGHFGGSADLALLSKVAEIRAINPSVEIGWDGGANAGNVVQLAEGGIDVLNVGSAIQHAEHPLDAYQHLVQMIS